MPAGRPTKYCDEVVKQICENIQLGLSQREAGLLVDHPESGPVCEDTIIEWKKKYPEFSEAMKAAMIRGKRALIARVRQAAKRDWRAAIAILERRHPEWAKKTAVATTDVPVASGAHELAKKLWGDDDLGDGVADDE